MIRCTGPCSRLLLQSEYPATGYGQCWDCYRGRTPGTVDQLAYRSADDV